MRTLAILLVSMLGSVGAHAAGPEYVSDPFGDDDFRGVPMIMEVNQPQMGRAEVGVAFVTSIIDKYSGHNGAMVDVTYHVLDTWALGLSVGMLHGGLTHIAADPAGIVGNRVGSCMAGKASGAECSSIVPNVPDYKQITGLADAYLMWSPLYGKINVVSEADVNVRLYGLVGLGVNGTREVVGHVSPTASGSVDPTDYYFSGGDLFAGGAFEGMKVNATAGLGFQLYLASWLSLRSELRGVFFRDAFEFQSGKPAMGYTSSYWFGHTGLTFKVF